MGNYQSLTGPNGLFNAFNGNIVTGNVTAEIISDLTETGEFSLNQWVEQGAGNYTLTITPNSAVNRTISGTYKGGLFRLSGADRVNIDGRFNNSGNYLTFINNKDTNNTATFQLISLGAGLGCSDITIRNCMVISLITTSMNVIKRKKAEEKLKMAHDELEEKVKERTLELTKANADLHVEIRERINTQSMLKETQQKLEKAQAIACVGNWEWVILSNSVEWSNEVFRVYGLDPEKDRPHYDTVIKALSPECRDAFINAVEDSLKYDKPFEGEYSIILPDGTRKFIYVKGEVIRSAEGKPLIMFGIVQDEVLARLARMWLSR